MSVDLPSPESDVGYGVPCPGPRKITGGGGDLTGGFGRVTLNHTVPEPLGDTYWFAGGEEDPGGGLPGWSLRSYVICASALPGHSLEQAGSPNDNSSPKTATVSCPAGKRVVGAGGRTANGDGHVALEGIVPNAALTAVTATAAEDPDGFDGNWVVVAYAVCADRPAGLQRVSASSPPDSEEINYATAPCPAGKNLLGTGVELVDADGRVALDDLRPNALLTSNTVTGIENRFHHPGDWSITAHAICASP